MKITIREPKTDTDFESLANLAQELANYHQEDLRPDPKKLKADTQWYSSRIVSVDGTDVGFVGWHRLYACQVAERAIELQNIFVDQQQRGHQLGFKLVLEVVRDAISHGCAELKIGLRKQNTSALEFYKKLGCSVTDRKDIWRCRLKRQGMEDMLAKAGHET
jgi:ribosomal protein S18 acetylase RimI-like enzyme